MAQPVYAIFGTEGQIGSALAAKFNSTPHAPNRVFAFAQSIGDVTNHAQIASLIEYVRPTVVFDCASISSHAACENDKPAAFNVNAKGAAVIAQYCRQYGSKLVYFSSADVFDGERTVPYTEKNITCPLNALGQSKVSGERAVRDILRDHLVIRPGWLFGHGDSGFLANWLEKAARGEKITVPRDYYGSPTFALDLADAAMELVEKDARGVFHFCNADAATWQIFADVVLNLASLKAEIESVDVDAQKGRMLIPKHSILSTRKYSLVTGKKPRSWTEALKHCLFCMNKFRPKLPA